MRRLVAAAWLLCAVAAACGEAPSSPSTSPTGAPTQSTRSAPTAPPAGTRALPEPAATWNPVRQPDGSFITEAVSAPGIPVGVPYRYPIGTHCGIAPTTFDVGGSFWDPIGDPSTFGLAEPEDPGTFVLLGVDEALWTSSTGFQVRLARGEAGPRQVFFCD
jgi:hypothetical protein